MTSPTKKTPPPPAPKSFPKGPQNLKADVKPKIGTPTPGLAGDKP
jgi:hypothetical protein